MEQTKALIMALNPGMSVSPRVHAQLMLKEKVTPEIVFFFVIANKKFILS